MKNVLLKETVCSKVNCVYFALVWGSCENSLKNLKCTICLSVSTLSVVFVLEMLFAYWGTGLLNYSSFSLVLFLPFIFFFLEIFLQTSGAVIIKELTNEGVAQWAALTSFYIIIQIKEYLRQHFLVENGANIFFTLLMVRAFASILCLRCYQEQQSMLLCWTASIITIAALNSSKCCCSLELYILQQAHI